MIVFDRKEKEIKVPEGLGNINLTVVDANLEDKTVEINEVETTILPSSGYNGMSSLQIDAQPVYDNGYSQGENIGYNSGYTAGDADGYNRGYNEGETDQKAKLTGITITENGTYSREDGYNEVVVDIIPEPVITFPLDVTLTENGTYNYDPTEYGDGYSSVKVIVDVPDLNGDYNEGYDAGKVDGYDSGYTAGIDYASENAEEIAAANAIDLVATEFGTYYTKYSDNIVYPNQVTGIYPDGEKFYNYSTGKYHYNTGLQTTENTKIEIWFYNDGVDNFGFNYFGTDKGSNYYFALTINPYGRGYTASIGGNKIDFTLEPGWYHLAMSFADGLVVDGEKIGNFNSNIIGPSNIEIGTIINSYAPNLTIGMIKIDDYVIIPTTDGLLNTTTNQLLQTAGTGVTYNYTNNTPPNILDNLIKSVNVQPKIDVAKYGLKFGSSTFAELPDFFDFSTVSDMSYMFDNNNKLQTITLDLSNTTNLKYAFNYCSSLKSAELLNTTNVTEMDRAFANCGSLITIAPMDTSNVSNIARLFYGCGSLQSLPPLNAGKMNMNNYGLFYNTTMNNLTDFGGLIGLRNNANNDYNFVKCPNLTYQSCINVLNGLYDFTGNGETPTSDEGNLKVHPNFLTTVGDEISIGINKNWTITA